MRQIGLQLLAIILLFCGKIFAGDSTVVARKDFLKNQNRFSVHIFSGAAFLPRNENTDETGLPRNIFGGFGPALMAGAGGRYLLSENFSAGFSMKYFSTAKTHYRMRLAGFGPEIKYNFLRGTRFSPFVIAGLNLAFVSMNRSSYSAVITPDISYSVHEPGDIQVDTISYSAGEVKVFNAPSLGGSLGAGIDMRLSYRLSVFVQYEIYGNRAKSNPLLADNFEYNESNLLYSTATAGISIRLGKNKARKTPTPLLADAIVNKEAFSAEKDIIILGQVQGEGLVEGTKVYLRDSTGAIIAEGVVDERGFFQFKNLPPENYTISLEEGNPGLKVNLILAEDDGSYAINRNRISDIQKDSATPIIITGRAINETNGIPASNQGIYLLNESGKGVQETKTNELGYFSFNRINPGDYRILPQNPDIKVNYRINAPDEELSFSLNQDNGLVAGRANEGGKVVLLLDSEGKVVGRTETSADGYFAFQKLAPDNYQIVFEESVSLKSPLLREVSDPDLRLSAPDLSPGKILLGELKDKDGKEGKAGIGVLLINDKGKVVDRAVTMDGGFFAFQKLPPDNYQIIIDEPGLNLKARLTQVEDDPDLRILLKEKSMNTTPENGNGAIEQISVSGMVIDKNKEKGKEGVTVFLLDERGDVIRKETTNDQGAFAFQSLPPENYQMLLDNPDPGLQVKYQVYEDQQMMPDKKRHKHFLAATVYFDLNSSILTEVNLKRLEEFIDQYKNELPGLVRIELHAYGDASGSVTYNLELTRKRGEAVKNALATKGFPSNKVKINPLGKMHAVKESGKNMEPGLFRKVELIMIYE